MSLYFLITLFGIVVASAGPLPYGMAECRDRAKEWRDHAAEAYRDKDLAHDPKMIIDGRPISMKDIDFVCLYAPSRPKLGEALSPPRSFVLAYRLASSGCARQRLTSELLCWCRPMG